MALIGLGLLHGAIVALQWRPSVLAAWRRRTYAGFYLDEVYTKAALTLWPTRWSPAAAGVGERRTDKAPSRTTS